jgi:hypothetical protein
MVERPDGERIPDALIELRLPGGRTSTRSPGRVGGWGS